MTGHDNGLITIELAEADDAEREQSRASMGEPYRTLLGHFRHEVGHYYWDRLVRDGGKLEPFRALFGDEQAGLRRGAATPLRAGPAGRLAIALRQRLRHACIRGRTSPRPGRTTCTSSTRSRRPRAFGLSTSTQARRKATSSTPRSISIPTARRRCRALIDAWLPLTFAVNSLNRSMGQPDLYPFVLSPPAIDKLGFVHEVVHAAEPLGGRSRCVGLAYRGQK